LEPHLLYQVLSSSLHVLLSFMYLSELLVRLVLPLLLLLKATINVMLPLLMSVQGVVHRLLSLLQVSEMQGYGKVIINRSPEVLFRWRHVFICWWCMKRVRSTSSVVHISVHRK